MERNTVTDTICAISTPAGIGGIAVVRISGPRALSITDSLWRGKSLSQSTTHTAHLGWLTDPDNGPLDQCVATIFRAPGSFTGDDVVELSIHGSRWLQQEAINLLLRHGCRLAEPGEFTRRAFASGHLDLAQAEAVADVIASQSRAAHRLAIAQMRGDHSRRLAQLRESLLQLASLLELELDFSEEDVEFVPRDNLIALATQIRDEITRLTKSFATGQAIRDGVPTAIVGHPNAGKSTLLNLLLGDDRAIVSDIPGTTRDTIEDTTQINGILFRFIDTAGLRKTADTIEQLGIQRTLNSVSRARLILWLVDATNPGDISDTAQLLKQHLDPQTTIIPILTKTDLIADTDTIDRLSTAWTKILPQNATQIHLLSARNRQGLDTLLATIPTTVTDNTTDDTIIITNARHYQALTLADQDLQRVVNALQLGIPSDLVAQDLRQALHNLGTITGTITTPDILSNIFSRFCIGK
jgi:tRNA modification GTPase